MDEYVYIYIFPCPQMERAVWANTKQYADIIFCTLLVSHYRQGADKQGHRVPWDTFTGTTVCGRNYAVSHSACCNNTWSLRWMTCWPNNGPMTGPEISQFAQLVWQRSPINMEAAEITSERRLSSKERLRLWAEKPEIVSLGCLVNILCSSVN